MNCFPLSFNLIVICIGLQFCIYLSDGLTWISQPSKRTLGHVGSAVRITWHYHCNQNFGFSKIVYDNDVEIAQRFKNEQNYSSLLADEVSHFSVIGGSNVTIIISDVDEDKSGKYCCEVRCLRKLPITSCTVLFVYALPRINYLTTSNLFAKQGDSITLRCNASGYPAPRVTWIHKDTNRTFANSSVTSFSITGKESVGNYCCHVSNGFGEETNCTSVKVTEYQPINTKLTSDMKFVTANKTFQVFCNADASPPANYSIKQGNITMVNSSDGNVTITTPNNGTYLAFGCIAKNKHGQGKEIYLKIPIYQPPTIVHHPNPRITKRNDSITLQCKATGTPKPNITWYDKLRNPIVEAANGTLLVQNEDCKNSTSQYYCVASNVVEDVKSHLITVEALQRKSVSFCKKKGSKNNDESILHSGPDWLLIIIVVACSLVTVALLLAFILFSRKRKKSKRDIDKDIQSIPANPRQNQLVEESPYGEPVDAIRARSVIHTSASNADYATVEETGYKRAIVPIQVQQPPHEETSSSKKCKSNVEPVYAIVNKNKKKNKSADVPLDSLNDEKPADLSNPKHPSRLLINHQDPKTSNNKNSNEQEDGVDSVDQGGSWIPWLY